MRLPTKDDAIRVSFSDGGRYLVQVWSKDFWRNETLENVIEDMERGAVMRWRTPDNAPPVETEEACTCERFPAQRGWVASIRHNVLCPVHKRSSKP